MSSYMVKIIFLKMFYYFFLNINFTEIQASNAPATIKRLPIARHVKYIIFELFWSSIPSIPSNRGSSYEAKMSNPPRVIATNEIKIQVTKDASISRWFLSSFFSISRSKIGVFFLEIIDGRVVLVTRES